MNKRTLIISFVALLMIFGLGVSIGYFLTNEVNPSVEVLSNVTFGKAPLNVSFFSQIYHVNEKEVKCLWDFNDGETANTRNITHIFHRQGTFNVTLTVWDENGFQMKDSIEINVIEYYKPTASIIADKTYGKRPLTVTFKADPFDIDGNEFNFQWDFDDGTMSTDQNTTHTFEESGVYYVHLTVYDKDGQVDTEKIEINVLDNHPPIALATADKEEGGPPLTVEFNGNGFDIDGDQLTYHWYFENTIQKDNRESTEQNPTHTFYFPGTYLVKLTVQDEEGAIDTDVVRIEVNENWFSKIIDHLFDFSLTKIIKQSIPDFIGNFILKFIGGILGNISNNFLSEIN